MSSGRNRRLDWMLLIRACSRLTCYTKHFKPASVEWNKHVADLQDEKFSHVGELPPLLSRVIFYPENFIRKIGPFRAHQISAPWSVLAPFLSLFNAGSYGVLIFPAFKTSFSPTRVTLPRRQFIQTVLCGFRNPLTRQNVSPDKKAWLNSGDGR